MVDPISVATIIGGASKAIGSALKLKDKGEILEAIIPIQEMLRDALIQSTQDQQKVYELSNENRELKSQLTSKEDLQAWRSKYKFEKSEAGNQVLALKEEYDVAVDYQYICATCYENNKKSGMQASGSILTCNSCKGEIKIKRQKPLVVSFGGRRESYDDF